MPQPVTVHRLGPADLPLARGLNALFGAAFDAAETYGAAPPDEAYPARLLRRAARSTSTTWRSRRTAGG